MTFIHNNKKDEGIKVLNELIQKTEVPNYIKELAKSELSTLKLMEKSI